MIKLVKSISYMLTHNKSKAPPDTSPATDLRNRDLLEMIRQNELGLRSLMHEHMHMPAELDKTIRAYLRACHPKPKKK